MGLDTNGILLVVMHTFKKTKEDFYQIRVISARKPTKQEAAQYLENNP